MSTPTVLLVHGAFAESASWKDVAAGLYKQSIPVTAVANPLRSVSGDAAYLRDIIDTIDGPVVLAGHSYGGLVITEAGTHPAVKALVYVAAFAGDTGETAFDLSGKFPGSTLGEALKTYPLSTGDTELAIRRDVFRDQFAADVPLEVAGIMGATQRPVTQKALTDPISDQPAWKAVPSWFVFGDQDRNIPAALQRFMADRASSRGTNEIAGASHAITVSQPEAVVESIVAAVKAVS